MKTLFPEMDKEINEDRKAAKRERVQRARDWLKGKDLSWLINQLLEKGPQTEAQLMWETLDINFHDKPAEKAADVLFALYSLWMTKKLWRKGVGIHVGSGEQSFIYGIKGVHKKP